MKVKDIRLKCIFIQHLIRLGKGEYVEKRSSYRVVHITLKFLEFSRQICTKSSKDPWVLFQKVLTKSNKSEYFVYIFLLFEKTSSKQS